MERPLFIIQSNPPKGYVLWTTLLYTIILLFLTGPLLLFASLTLFTFTLGPYTDSSPTLFVLSLIVMILLSLIGLFFIILWYRKSIFKRTRYLIYPDRVVYERDVITLIRKVYPFTQVNEVNHTNRTDGRGTIILTLRGRVPHGINEALNQTLIIPFVNESEKVYQQILNLWKKSREANS